MRYGYSVGPILENEFRSVSAPSRRATARKGAGVVQLGFGLPSRIVEKPLCYRRDAVRFVKGGLVHLRRHRKEMQIGVHAARKRRRLARKPGLKSTLIQDEWHAAMKILGAVTSARRDDCEGLKIVLPALPEPREAHRAPVFSRDIERLLDRFRRQPAGQCLPLKIAGRRNNAAAHFPGRSKCRLLRHSLKPGVYELASDLHVFGPERD